MKKLLLPLLMILTTQQIKSIVPQPFLQFGFIFASSYFLGRQVVKECFSIEKQCRADTDIREKELDYCKAIQHKLQIALGEKPGKFTTLIHCLDIAQTARDQNERKIPLQRILDGGERGAFMELVEKSFEYLQRVKNSNSETINLNRS